LSTTNPTCCPDANPGRHGGKPATNRLSYGTALFGGNIGKVKKNAETLIDASKEVGLEINAEKYVLHGMHPVVCHIIAFYGDRLHNNYINEQINTKLPAFSCLAKTSLHVSTITRLSSGESIEK
jgi:hypothetical protein